MANAPNPELSTLMNTTGKILNQSPSEILIRFSYLTASFIDSLEDKLPDEPRLSVESVWLFALRNAAALELVNVNRYPVQYVSTARLLELTGFSKTTWKRRMDDLKKFGELTKVYLLIYKEGGWNNAKGQNDANAWSMPQPIFRMMDSFDYNLQKVVKADRFIDKHEAYKLAAEATRLKETGEQLTMKINMTRKGQGSNGGDSYAKQLHSAVDRAALILKTEPEPQIRAKHTNDYVDFVFQSIIKPSFEEKVLTRNEVREHINRCRALIGDLE